LLDATQSRGIDYNSADSKSPINIHIAIEHAGESARAAGTMNGNTRLTAAEDACTTGAVAFDPRCDRANTYHAAPALTDSEYPVARLANAVNTDSAITYTTGTGRCLARAKDTYTALRVSADTRTGGAHAMDANSLVAYAASACGCLRKRQGIMWEVWAGCM
jgi:hypothetical protein